MLTSGYQSITGSATNNAFDQLVDDFCLGVAAPCGSNVDVPVTDTICGATGTIPPQGGCDVISNGSSMSFAKTATFASTQTLVGTLKDTGAFGNCPPTNNPPTSCVTGTGTITQVRNQFGGQVPEP